MKVLIVNKFLYPNGGSETYIFEIGKQLEKMGHEIQYFGMEHQDRIVGNHAESYTSNLDFHAGKLSKVLYPLKIIYSVEARKKIRQVLEDFNPEVVHLNNFNFQLTPSIIYEIKAFEKKNNRKISIIYTAHDSQLVCPNHLMQNPVTGERCTQCLKNGVGSCVKGKCIHGSGIKSIMGAFEGWLYNKLRTYKYIDKIICPSNFMREKLETSEVLRNKIEVMPNFISGELTRYSEGNKQDYVIYFGRYSYEKGIATLLSVCRRLPEIRFVFAGNGPLENDVNILDNIDNKGFLTGNELYTAISNALFMVMPSECYENCPFSVMESITLGTPVIGADLGGIPELVKDGINGELFVSGDEEELYNKIVKLWKDRDLISKYSKNCKRERFDTAEGYCVKLVELYKSKRGNT